VHQAPNVQPMTARSFLQPFAQNIIMLFMGGFLLKER
jgi:hypothetical protein